MRRPIVHALCDTYRLHLDTETAAILYFSHFPYNIRLLLNIAPIWLDVQYFDAKSSEKINCYRQNAQNYSAEQIADICLFCHFS